jgi:hypothetical protein
MTEPFRRASAALALAAATCAIYAPSLSVGFFSDDYQWLGRMNATLERPSYVLTVFFRDFNPILHASFALDWIIGGGRAAVWHADSILLHGLATALLFMLCSRLGASLRLALAGAALWAVNVRLSEAVIWPAARGHQFAAVCSLAALVLLLGHGRYRRWFALGLLGLGLFAKETTLFAIAAIPFFLPDRRKERPFLIGLAALVGGFVLLNVLIKDDLHTSGAGLLSLLYKTPFILLRPLGLGDYARFDAITLILTVAVFVALAFWLRRSFGLAGVLWVLACSAPIVALDKLSSRYLYLPAIGYSVVFCALCVEVGPLLRTRWLQRLAGVSLILGVASIVVGNALWVQREIGDYRQLAAPYTALVERVTPGLAGIAEGETFVLVDGAAQTTIMELTQRIQERGNMTKLIPYRRHAIDGLIELPDLLNVARPREPGLLGRAAPLVGSLTEAAPIRWFFYDGQRLSEAAPREDLPPERLHHASWGAAERYFNP